MFRAMTFEFHRNHYRSPRGPSDAAVMVKMPKSLSHDLTALTLAYEEPKYSILTSPHDARFRHAGPFDIWHRP